MIRIYKIHANHDRTLNRTPNYFGCEPYWMWYYVDRLLQDPVLSYIKVAVGAKYLGRDLGLGT